MKLPILFTAYSLRVFMNAEHFGLVFQLSFFATPAERESCGERQWNIDALTDAATRSELENVKTITHEKQMLKPQEHYSLIKER